MILALLLVTEEKHNSAQRKQTEPGAGVVMKRNLSTSFLEYEEKLCLHNSKKIMLITNPGKTFSN